jgi:CRP-like cAMP-binding protein
MSEECGMADFNQSCVRNHLLRSLAPSDFAALLPHFKRTGLLPREVLYAPNEPILVVYFPEQGYASMLATLREGDAAEVGMVGREGMLGVPIILGTDRSNLEAVVQGEGRALQVDADVIRHVVDENPAIRALLLRYAMAFSVQVTMTAACNNRHVVNQRIARWLLMADDRIGGSGDFAMTHEFLALMLGVRRSGVTVAAGALQKAGLIRYEHGRMHVTDRTGLEAAACECHLVANREYERLLGSPILHSRSSAA